MSHEEVKLEAWQAAVSPKPDCCTERTSKASGLTVGSLVVYVKKAMLFIVFISMIECLGRSLNVQLTCASTFEVRMRK